MNKAKQLTRLASEIFYDLVLTADPSYVECLGSVRTTLTKIEIYNMKKEAMAKAVKTMSNNSKKTIAPKMVPFADLIDDFGFIDWCQKNPDYRNTSVTKWRYAYIIHVKGARRARESAKILNCSINAVYVMVNHYECAARKYKAEQHHE